MYKYLPLIKSNYGKLLPENDISKFDFFSMITPENREEIVNKEAQFYRENHKGLYEEGVVENRYININDHLRIKEYVSNKKESSNCDGCFIFIHGGAFITCSVETHDFIPWYITKETGYKCYSIDYRLAPEFPYPFGLLDCKEALNWIYNNSSLLGIDKEKIVVSGDSSGGNIAAVLALMDRDDNSHMISREVLFVPLVDVFAKIPKTSKEIYGWPVVDFAHIYCSEELAYDPYVSPLFCGDLSNICPTFFVQAECDGICDDGLYYAKKLKDFGIEVHSHIYEGVPHSFNVYAFKESINSLNDVCSYLKNN